MRGRRRSPLPFVAVLAAVAIVVAACGSSGSDGGSDNAAAPVAPKSPAPTGSPLVIGTVGQYSGFAGATSKATADSLEAWAQLTNDHGGIAGHPVKVIVKDDGNDPAKALSAVKSMVENDKIIALVGIHESGLESAWKDYIDGKKIPVIGGSSTAVDWLTDPNFFPTAQTPINYISLQLNAVKLAGKKKVGMVVCSERPACSQGIPLAQNAAKTLGLDFAAGARIPAAAPNYTSQCLAMRSAGVEAVVLNTAGEVSERFAADCAKQNYRPVLISPGQSFDKKLTENANYEGAYLANDSFNWFGDGSVSKEYLAAMKAYKPDSPLNSSGTAGYAAGMVFGKAAAKVSATPTSAEIYAGLYALPAKNTLGGLIPPTTYAKDSPAVVEPCGWYGQLKDGEITSPQGSDAICIDAAR